LSATRLLVVSRGAGSMNEAVEAKLRKAFSDYLVVDFDPKEDYEKLISPRARIVVAGGDGTVEFMVRRLADTKHPVGVIPMGTFNNLARGLGLPTDVGAAIDVARDGRTQPITLGRVNGRIFVEVCAIGLFGEAIILGEGAKDMEFGKLATRLKDVIAARPFKYKLAGDIDGDGSAMSLVFSNTASVGSQLPVSDSTPMNPWLEFTVHVGRTRTDIVGRALKSAVLQQHEEETAQVFRFGKLEVTTTPRVRVYADNTLVGRTPATITAEKSALKVMMPKRKR
jgi:diacylglycerol kinase (ATP)